MRLDQNIGSRQTAFARFSYKKRDVQNAPTGSVNAGPTLAPEIDAGFTVAHNFVITPRLVNEFRGGFNGTQSSSSNKTSAVQTLAALGFTGIPDPPPGSGGPSFSITGFQGASFGSSSISKGNTLQFIDNLTWVNGRHTLKFGGDYRYMTAYFSNVFASSRAGSYTFNNSVTSSLIGNAYASFLLGIPDSTRPRDGQESGHFLLRIFVCVLRAGRLEAHLASDGQLTDSAGNITPPSTIISIISPTSCRTTIPWSTA